MAHSYIRTRQQIPHRQQIPLDCKSPIDSRLGPIDAPSTPHQRPIEVDDDRSTFPESHSVESLDNTPDDDPRQRRTIDDDNNDHDDANFLHSI